MYSRKSRLAKISWMLERKAALFQRSEIYAVRIAIRNCALTLKSFSVDRPAMIMILECGEDIVYYFDSEDVYECPKCGTIIQIKGWIREYPLGAYDSEEINVSQWRT